MCKCVLSVTGICARDTNTDRGFFADFAHTLCTRAAHNGYDDDVWCDGGPSCCWTEQRLRRSLSTQLTTCEPFAGCAVWSRLRVVNVCVCVWRLLATSIRSHRTHTHSAVRWTLILSLKRIHTYTHSGLAPGTTYIIYIFIHIRHTRVHMLATTTRFARRASSTAAK